MASEYRNPYSKKYSKVTEKELHTVIPFTSDIATNARYSDLRAETSRLAKEYVGLFNQDAKNFKKMLKSLTDQKSQMTLNERKALKKIQRGAKTIANYRYLKGEDDVFVLARLKSGMEELLGGISTMQKYDLLDVEEYAFHIYDLTAEYGQLIFQTGRRFKKELTPSTEIYNARLNQINALRGAYREIGQYSSAGYKYSHRMDVTLVAVVSATLHCNVTEAIELIALSAPYRGGPDVGEMTLEDFYNMSEAVYPEWQRLLEEEKRKAEARAKMLEEVKARINIIVGMRDILNANFRLYTDEPFEPSSFTEEDIWNEMMEDVPQDGFDIKAVLKDMLYNPQAMTKIAGIVSDIGDSLLNPLRSFAKAISAMQVGTDLGMSFADLMGLPLASLLFTLNLSLSSMNTLSEMTSATTGILTGALNKASKLLAGDDDDDDDDDIFDSDSGGKTGSRWNIVTAVAKIILSIVSVVLKGLSIGFTVVSSVISTGFSMFTGLLSSMLKMLKEIFGTSKLMEDISNILSLCLTMFFMPFFMSFGNALLETVFNILFWTRDNGLSFVQNYGEKYLGIFDTITDYFIDHREQLANIATEFIETVYTMLLELAPDFMKFVSYMMETFVDNKELLMDMLKEGIAVGKELLANKIFQMYLYYGTLFMSFIDKNADWIKKTFEKATALVEVCLGAFSWVMDHMLLFCLALGGAIGTLSAMAGVATLSTKIVEKVIAKGVSEMGPIFMKLAGPVAKEYMKSTVFTAALSAGAIGTALGGLFYATFFSFGRGGYIPATPGGLLAIVAEKETEYIIPESKMHLIRGHNNIIISFNDDVFMLNDPSNEIKAIASEMTQTSHYR